ncbi:MAG: serine/threonine protein kinase [Planctomycetales bacterium]|nr:serine/threonine protein kinase [Planctomycetales bacterium]
MGDATAAGAVVPARLGPFEILGVVARGGMGVVYRARREPPARVVALKVLREGPPGDPETARLERRFQREAEAVARLRHPAIVPVHEVGEVDGRPYFTMDLIEGESLDRMARAEAGLAPRRAAEILADVAEAIQCAHDHGVLHRDLKPGNVLVDRAGRPYLTDFGLARPVEFDTQVTATGSTVGTPAYMAPEQARGLAEDVGRWTDVYGLGATLYEALAGRPPFEGDSGVQVLLRVIQESPVPPRRVRKSVPRALEVICLKALSKEAGDRYASAGEMADDLRRFLRGEPVRARPLGPIERAWRGFLSHTSAFLLGGVACLVFFLAGGYGVERYRESAEQEARRPPPVTLLDEGFGEPAARPADGPPDGWVSHGNGTVRRREGALCLRSADRRALAGASVASPRRAVGGLRLEVDLLLPGDEGRGGAFGCAIHADPADPFRTGYHLRFGEAGGRSAVLLRAGVPVRSVGPRPLVRRARVHRITLERRFDEVTATLDGVRLLVFSDERPLRERDEAGTVLVYAIGDHVHVDGVHLGVPGIPEIESPLASGDAFYGSGLVVEARRLYRLAWEGLQRTEWGPPAWLRVARCDAVPALEGGGKGDVALAPVADWDAFERDLRERVLSAPTGDPARGAGLLLLARVEAEARGRPGRARQALVEALGPSEDPEARGRAALALLRTGEARLAAGGGATPAGLALLADALARLAAVARDPEPSDAAVSARAALGLARARAEADPASWESWASEASPAARAAREEALRAVADARSAIGAPDGPAAGPVGHPHEDGR